MNYFYGFLMAWGMFTIIPCPYSGWKEEARGHMLVCFPLVGAVIGGIWYGAWLGTEIVPLYLRAVILTVIPWIFTGFMHLDGYMDVCDAVMSRRDVETKQRILKDSHVGAFAVICLCILILAEAGSVMTLLTRETEKNQILGILFIPVASRMSASLALFHKKPMHTSQYVGVSKKMQFNIVLGILLLATLSTFILSFRIGISIVVTMLAYWICAIGASKSLGGMNGDVSGYALVLAELFGLIGLAI